MANRSHRNESTGAKNKPSFSRRSTPCSISAITRQRKGYGHRITFSIVRTFRQEGKVSSNS
jgi:hypothetical protein